MRSFDYLKTYRGMPWIKRGMVADMNGKRGRVTAGAGGGVNIRFDGEKHSSPCHPHWEMTYYDAEGNIIKDYKEKKAEG